MAEEQQQSKGIGELFVEFGAKGLGTLLKGMNIVSASFLLAKKAGKEFTDMLTKPVKQAGQAAVQFGKMSKAFGISLQEYMKLHLYLKHHNLSDSLLNDLISTSDMLTKVQMGIGGISGEFAYAMNKMGLSWRDYDGSMESMIQLANDVKKATEGMDEAQKRVLRQAVGLSNPEWNYAFERGDFDLSEYKNVSDKEVQDLIKSQEELARLDAEMEQLKMHLISKLTPVVITIANFLSDKTGNAAEGKYDKPVVNAAKATTKTATHAALATPLATPLLLGAGLLGTFNNLKNQVNTPKGTATGGAAPIVPPIMQNGHIPPNLSNMSTNITVNNENKVTVANPQDAGVAISSINQETLTNINYNQAQITNRPGL